MNKSVLKSLFIILVLSIAISSCDEDSDNLEKDTLYVKFENNNSSEYAIIGIQLLQMGNAGTLDEPIGAFGVNIIEDGVTIIPGGHAFFTLDISNLHYAYYRLTVDNGTGTNIFLHDQTNYEDSYDGTITHWGGDDRTVSVTIKTNENLDLIYIQSWSDMVGID